MGLVGSEHNTDARLYYSPLDYTERLTQEDHNCDLWKLLNLQ